MEFRKLSGLIGVAVVIASGAVHAQSNAERITADTNQVTNVRLSSESTIGELLDNPAARQILIKHFKMVTEGDSIDQTRGMSLRMLQSYAPERISDKALGELDADLAKLPQSEGEKAKQ